MEVWRKFLNKYCVVWFSDGTRTRVAKGRVSFVNENFIGLEDPKLGFIVINIEKITKISTNQKGENQWKTQE
jgi:hypothetical protein